MNRAATRRLPLRPLDWLFLSYVLPSGIVLLFGGLAHAGLLAVHVLLVFIAFPASRLAERENFWLRLFASTYPLFFVILLYREVDILNQLVHGTYYDEQIMAFDTVVFGPGLHQRLLTWFPYGWLEGLLNAGYISYYIFLPAGAIPLAWKSRWLALEEFTFTTFLTYAVCYALFIAYPVVGPFFELHPPGSFVNKDAVTRVAYTIVNRWGARGAAFPSAHVAVAVVVVALAGRYGLVTFWVLLPCAIGLTCATVYCGYHYAIDVAAGIFVGLFMLALAPALRSLLETAGACRTCREERTTLSDRM